MLLYGHLDKQPEMTGWAEDLGPWKPVLKGDRLYGRGGADDGYAIFGSLTAIRALQEQGLPHARCVVLIEACEESGSYDLPFYVDHLAERIGKPSLVVCLDSGCANYDQLWCTTSLRGLAGGNLRGRACSARACTRATPPASCRRASACCASCSSRLEDEATGKILLEELYVEIPEQRVAAGRARRAKCSATTSSTSSRSCPAWCRWRATSTELILNRTWRPVLSVTGADGMPPLSNAGNVLRPYTAVKL